MSVTLFDSTDNVYLDWMNNHPEGVVVNTTRERSRYAMLHASNCYHITKPSKVHALNAFTGDKYIKICSDRADDLIDWAQRERPNAYLRRCKTCAPAIGAPVDDPDAAAVELAEDIHELEARDDLTPTERMAMVKARLGQGQFRSGMLELWEGKCAVTGCNVATALTASHAKPWSTSEDQERLDANNGLPLVASLDRLFDQYLIAFDPATGVMSVAPGIDEANQKILGIPHPLRQSLNSDQARYLQIHFEAFREKHKAASVVEDAV